MKDKKINIDFDKNILKEIPLDLVDPVFSPNSLQIMAKRHLLKDKTGKTIENPKQMLWRVASSIALEDSKYVKGAGARKLKAVQKTARKFYNLMANNEFLPGSRVLFEAGNDIDGTGQLSSCFVLPVEDSLDSVFQTMKEAAIVQKNNGGTGFNFSHIRPKGDDVGGTPNVAAGPIHFIKSFSQSFDQILQGKKRGGGNMAILNVNHPDILEFISLKKNEPSIRNFNISVGITDDFMNALQNNEEYELINPRTNKAVKKIKAKEVFDKICEVAWDSADPGLFFIDKAQAANPTKQLGAIEATNPCGEEPLRPYESCNLGSVVMTNHLTSDNSDIDWEKLKSTVSSAIQFLDNMIDLSRFPLDKITYEVSQTRKLGLGIVGFASMLMKMELPYNSEKAVMLMEKLIKFIEDESIKASVELAKDRGVFPGFKGSDWDQKNIHLRNATLTSVAPTGTLSLLAETSSGIEPVFSLVYKTSVFFQDDGKENQKNLLYVDKVFEEYAKKNKFYSEKLIEKISQNNGRLEGIDGIPEKAKEIFVTTHEINPEWHVKMQAAAQKNIDAAVSKTINMHESATIEDVRQAYINAWKYGCKGITIYRDGSKSNQVLENINKSKDVKSAKMETNLIENELADNAIEVLGKRSLIKDDNGNIIETPKDLWMRIATFIASAEELSQRETYAKKFFDVMNSGLFYCGGTLIWAGMGKDTILSKCLVLPVEDSIDSIFDTLNWNIQCLRRGVGTGFNFSTIRSSYSKVSTTGEFAAGPVEYIKMYNRAQDTIKGRGGRGLGSMAILNAEHPDIETFINCKDDYASMSHYNISVGASDKFMKAVKDDAPWDLIDPHDGEVKKTIKARELFESIAKHAWLSGDPGMFFLNRAEKDNTTPSLGKMTATNPCGEQPLIPFETCNMGHINLSKIVKGFPLIEEEGFEKKTVEEKLELIDWKTLEYTTEIAVRFLDDIIDVNHYPIKQIEEMTKKTRNIGVGIMGFSDVLIKLGIEYGSDESTVVAEKIMSFINKKAHEASERIGLEKGSFPAFRDSVWFKKRKAMRNTRVTTIAPTGTISIVGNCNPGIEPMFALGYTRKNSMGGTNQMVIEPLIKSVAEKYGFGNKDFYKAVSEGATLSSLTNKFDIPKHLVNIFKTSHDIDPEKQVQIQATFQKFIDSAVSKTINLKKDSSWQDIARIYMLSYDLNCKGITVFRDGSKDPVLMVGQQETIEENKVQEVVIQQPQVVVQQVQMPRNLIEPRPRGEFTTGRTYEVKTEQGDLYVTINSDDKGIIEVFLTLGKSGSFTAGYTEALGRLISMSLRSGIKPASIIKQLQGIRTSSPTLNKGMIVYSVPDAVAKIIKKYLEEKESQISMLNNTALEVKQAQEIEIKIEDLTLPTKIENLKVEEVKTVKQEIVLEKKEEDHNSKYTKNNHYGDLLECPECGSDLEYAEGCILCRACGFSKCG